MTRLGIDRQIQCFLVVREEQKPIHHFLIGLCTFAYRGRRVRIVRVERRIVVMSRAVDDGAFREVRRIELPTIR